MRKFVELLFVGLFSVFSGRASKTEVSSEKPVRVALSDQKQRALEGRAIPAKGRFLDYIYQIQPDHKQPGYQISTDRLNDGYAIATGPYDGVLIEFFLFRGDKKDYVLRQTTGPGAKDLMVGKTMIGPQIEAFSFEGTKYKKIDVKELLHLGKANLVLDSHTMRMQQRPEFHGWKFYRRLGLPIKGTAIDVQLCKESPEPPFAVKTTCAQAATLTWTRRHFLLKSESLAISEETI